MQTEVLIIGAGPTGLMLANQLNRFGIDFIIADSKSEPTKESRALAVSARSMELYQQLGLSETVLEQATEVLGFKIFMNGTNKADIQLEGLGKGISDFENFMNAFEQNKNEKLLNENLQKHNQNVLWNHSFVEFREEKDKIFSTVKNCITNEIQTITSKYLISCEGAKSAIRKQLNLKFEGGTYENKFFVADTTLEWQHGYEKIILVPADNVFITFFPLKGNKKIRVIGTLPKSFEDKEEIDFEELEKVIRENTKLEFDITDVGWHSVYKLHHRCVDVFSKGNVFLAGDSAHIHSPAGGQGMNTGLQDAHNLAWKIAFVLKGIAKPEILSTYNEERLPFAKALLNSTDKGFTFMAGTGFGLRFIRKYLMIPIISNLLKFSFFRRFAFKKIAQVDYSYKSYELSKTLSNQNLTFKSGDRIPYVEKGYYNNFKDPMFHLIRISNSNLTQEERRGIEKTFPFDVKIVENTLSDAWKKLGVKTDLYILIRPDQHISIISDKLNKIEIDKQLSKHFNLK